MGTTPCNHKQNGASVNGKLYELEAMDIMIENDKKGSDEGKKTSVRRAP